MGTVLEGGEGGDLDAGGGGQWSKIPRRGEGPEVCRIFYLKHLVFVSWHIGTFDSCFALKTNVPVSN